MGYPMTYQRLLHRNGLAEGDALHVPVAAHPMAGWNLDAVEHLAPSVVRTAVVAANTKTAVLLDDLRRLERDATDEAAIAQHIAARTGVDVETVAAVLKEFISW